NSSARRRARSGSGSHTASTRARAPRFRQATRWYQLIMPAPASATPMGVFRGRPAVIAPALPRSPRPSPGLPAPEDRPDHLHLAAPDPAEVGAEEDGGARAADD